MKYLSAYLLCQLGGNATPSVDDLSKVLESVGIDVDKTAAEKVCNELNGKNLEEVVAAGREKMGSMPAMGAGGAGAAADSGPAAAEADSKPAEVEEKKEESEESDDDDMGLGLFD